MVTMNDLRTQFKAWAAVQGMERLDASANAVPRLENSDLHPGVN
jgi:hypothetical protein